MEIRSSRNPSDAPAVGTRVTTDLAMEEGEERASLEARLLAELPRVRNFLRRLVQGSGLDAEDLTQETAARALAYRNSFDARRGLGPWLRRTAFRAFLDQRERRLRAPEAFTGEEDPPAATADEVAGRDLLEHLVARLAPIERDVLLRFHRSGESVREIASAIGVAEGTVKSHLHRARRRIAELHPEEDR